MAIKIPLKNRKIISTGTSRAVVIPKQFFDSELLDPNRPIDVTIEQAAKK